MHARRRYRSIWVSDVHLGAWDCKADLLLDVVQTHASDTVAKEARRHSVDGVICGHIHPAELPMIGDLAYANSGDWVESSMTRVEDLDGQLDVLRYVQLDRTTGSTTVVDGVPSFTPGDPSSHGCARSASHVAITVTTNLSE